MSYKFLFCFVYLPLSLSFLGSVRCCHFVFTHGERPKFCMYVINVVYTYIYFFLDIYLNIDVVDVMDIKGCYTSTYYKLPFSAVRCLIATLDIQCVYRLLRFCFVFVWCLWHLITHSHSRMASTKQHERKGKKRKEKTQSCCASYMRNWGYIEGEANDTQRPVVVRLYVVSLPLSLHLSLSLSLVGERTEHHHYLFLSPI